MFVEVALAGIAVALEHQEVSIVGDLPANRTYLFGIEKFWWRPLLLLLLAFAFGGRCSQRPTRPSVVDSRQQL